MQENDTDEIKSAVYQPITKYIRDCGKNDLTTTVLIADDYKSVKGNLVRDPDESGVTKYNNQWECSHNNLVGDPDKFDADSLADDETLPYEEPTVGGLRSKNAYKMKSGLYDAQTGWYYLTCAALKDPDVELPNIRQNQNT